MNCFHFIRCQIGSLSFLVYIYFMLFLKQVCIVSVSISLQGLGLSGELATSSLCRVRGLVALSFASNGFNQTTPLELSCCALLASLNLSNGAFWGPLPEQQAMLTSLMSLDHSYNSFEGQVPAGLAALGGLL